MEASDEQLGVSPTSDETLSGLRELSVQCRELLHQLSGNDRLDDHNRVQARDMMAAFNIWAANMGVFRQGQQSLASRLKSAPKISELFQQLLMALQRDLERAMRQRDNQDEHSTTTDSDDSSDRSSTSYRLLSPSDDDEAQPLPPPTIWTSIQDSMNRIHQVAQTVRLAGSQHRQERIQRFRNLDGNREVYELFKKYTRQRVDHLFAEASQVLRERMAESVATRRSRFLYLERHQKKTSTLNNPAPVLQEDEPPEEEENIPVAIQPGQQQAARNLPFRQVNRGPSVQPSVILSNTVDTKLDPKRLRPEDKASKRAGSVSSVKISTGNFPPIPKLDPGGTSFSCPYCFMVCPAKEASGQSQWISHLIHDFEPFFCVFDSCSSPFTCADTYTGWLAHMRDTHTQTEWQCWHCKAVSPSSSKFLTPEELGNHLEMKHPNGISDSLRPTLIKHSMVRDQYTLQDCPFCGGFPEEIENSHPDRDKSNAREALQKHVRDHLVSVALILVPVEMGESDSQLDDSGSNAQRSDGSKHDIAGVGDTYELECQNESCDCKDNKKSSDWSTGPGDLHSDGDMGEFPDATAQLFKKLLDENLSRESVHEDKTLLAFAENFGQNESPNEKSDFWESDTEPNFTEESLKDKISRVLVESVFDTPPRYFAPEGSLDGLITRKSIIKEMGFTGEGREESELIEYILGDGKKLFATAVYAGLTNAMILQFIMQTFMRQKYTSNDLRFLIDEDIKLGASHGFSRNILNPEGIGEFMALLHRRSGNILDPVEIEEFLEVRWIFLAPVFDDDTVKLEEQHILPFVEKEEDATVSLDQFYKVAIHESHLKNTHAQTNEKAYFNLKPLDLPSGVDRKTVSSTWKAEVQRLKLVTQLNRPNIVRFITAFTRPRSGNKMGYYLLFEWADMGSLFNLWIELRRPGLGAGIVEDVVRQLHGISDTLKYIHSLRISHGNLDSASILVFRDRHSQSQLGTLKIGGRWAADTSDPRYGQTPYVVPPQQITDSAKDLHDPRLHDIWAMGCVILEFIIWFLHGPPGVVNFRHQLCLKGNPRLFDHLGPDDAAVVPPAALQWADHISSRDPECNGWTDMSQLLDVVKNRLLVVSLPAETDSVSPQGEIPLADGNVNSELTVAASSEPKIGRTDPRAHSAYASVAGNTPRGRARADELEQCLAAIVKAASEPGGAWHTRNRNKSLPKPLRVVGHRYPMLPVAAAQHIRR